MPAGVGQISAKGGGSSSPATATTIGGVIVPAAGNLTVDVLGNIGAPTASDSTLGVVKQGPGDRIQADGKRIRMRHSVASYISSLNLFDRVQNNLGSFLNDDGSIGTQAGYAISNYFTVASGDLLILEGGIRGPSFGRDIIVPGCFYNGTTYVSAIKDALGPTGFITVPAGVNAIRMTLWQSTQTGYFPPYLYKLDLSRNGFRSFSSIAGMGDSIMIGASTTNPFLTEVASRLGIATISNQGIGGSTVSTVGSAPLSPMCQRMSSIPSTADLIFFEGIGNDFNTGVPLGTIADTVTTTAFGALNICAEYLVNRFPFATIVWVTVPRWTTADTLNTQSLGMDPYVAAFKQVANNRGFLIADGYTLLSAKNAPGGRNIVSDFGHPTNIGHMLLSDIIMDVLV